MSILNTRSTIGGGDVGLSQMAQMAQVARENREQSLTDGAPDSPGMSAFQRAWLELSMALAVYHATEACESQVVQWVIEGRASYADLLAARSQVKMARLARAAARRRYLRLSSTAAEQAGKTAGAAHAPAH